MLCNWIVEKLVLVRWHSETALRDGWHFILSQLNWVLLLLVGLRKMSTVRKGSFFPVTWKERRGSGMSQTFSSRLRKKSIDNDKRKPCDWLRTKMNRKANSVESMNQSMLRKNRVFRHRSPLLHTVNRHKLILFLTKHTMWKILSHELLVLIGLCFCRTDYNWIDEVFSMFGCVWTDRAKM